MRHGAAARRKEDKSARVSQQARPRHRGKCEASELCAESEAAQATWESTFADESIFHDPLRFKNPEVLFSRSDDDDDAPHLRRRSNAAGNDGVLSPTSSSTTNETGFVKPSSRLKVRLSVPFRNQYTSGVREGERLHYGQHVFRCAKTQGRRQHRDRDATPADPRLAAPSRDSRRWTRHLCPHSRYNRPSRLMQIFCSRSCACCHSHESRRALSHPGALSNRGPRTYKSSLKPTVGMAYVGVWDRRR